MTKILLRDLKSKKGVVIKRGESVTLKFDVCGVKGGKPLASFVSLNTEDGRRICTRNFSSVGFKMPKLRTLERWANDGICKSVFGNQIEPDGWDADGSPSWLLVVGVI